MGSNTNISNSNGKGGEVAIPANARKIIQSLKEIVNYPDLEIYAMLKECNMDPNDAVQKLLSQDTFHEVKSRREKKKEPKDSSDYKPRGPSSRGGRAGLDRAASRAGSVQYGSNESGGTRSKSVPKKENGIPVLPSSSTYAACIPGSSDSRKFDSISDLLPLESIRHTGDSDGSTTLSSQPTSGYRSAYVGIPGQPSMADIVRSGRPSNKPPSSKVSSISSSQTMNANPSQSSSHLAKQSLLNMPTPPLSQHELLVSHDHSSKVRDALKYEADITQHVADDGWSMVEQSSTNASSVSDPSGASVACADSNDMPVLFTEAPMNSSYHVDEKLSRERSVSGQPLPADASGTAFTSNIHMVMDNTATQDSNHFNDAHLSGHPSYESQGVSFEDSQGFEDDLEYSIRDYSASEVVEDVNAAVSSNVARMQQLSLRKEDTASSRTDDNVAVIMPDHLHDPSVDCSHLSFGSFGSGISAAFSAGFSVKSSKDTPDETCVPVVTSSVDASAIRNSEYTAIHQLQVASNENLVPSSLENFDSTPSQPEVVKDINVETAQAQEYPFPSSVPNYAFESTSQATPSTYPYQQTDSSLPSLSPLSTMMQAYGNPSQSNLLASSAQLVKESDLSFSSFLTTQSMPTKYGSVVSSISGPSISIPEVGKSNLFPQSTVQNIPSGSLHATPTLPQVPLQTYSQLPLGHFGNMLSYSYLPQSFAYLPSAFQAYAGNSGYHPSPAAPHGTGMKYSLPQYKSSMPMNSLTPSSPMPAGYGAYGSSGNIRGNFTLNSASNPGATPTSYDDILASQYKDNNHFLSIPQNESSAMWMHAAGSRSVSGLPSSTYYTLQGQQNQQQAILRQMQQISQYAPAGYTNFYHSQSGISPAGLDQQHAQGDATATQGPASDQSHQIWARSY